MENIGNYLHGCLALGLKKTDLFDTPDLFEEKNINLVISNIHVLANHIHKFYSDLKLPSIKSANSNSHGSSPLKLYSSIVHSRFGVSNNNITFPDDYNELLQWVNQHLKSKTNAIQNNNESSSSAIQCNDMSNDLRNCVYLLSIIEDLTNQRVGIYTKDPILPWHYMQNIFLILNFMRDNSLYSAGIVSAHDIFNGDVNSICILIRLIRENFDRDHYFKTVPVDIRRQRVVEEIVSTEESYVKSLSTVFNSLIVPLQNALESSSKPILTEEEIFSIFGNWERILLSHITLLKEFKSIIEKWNDDSTLGDLFLEKCEFLKDNYADYINNYDNSYQRIKRLRKGNEDFDQIINTFEMYQDSNNGLDLYSYLIMPIQRIPRYLLLLKELLKYTPTNHQDHSMLQNAKENMKRVADHVNESKMLVDNTRKINSIQESISQLDINLNDENRKYIREGFLEIEDTASKSSYFFLFNDILLFVKYKPSEETGKEFKFKEIFYLQDVIDICDILSDDEEEEDEDEEKQDDSENSGEYEINFIKRPTNRKSKLQQKKEKKQEVYSFEIETQDFSLILKAESQSEKISWMEDLKACIQHHLIKDEDQLSDLSIDDSINSDDHNNDDDDQDFDNQINNNDINDQLLLVTAVDENQLVVDSIQQDLHLNNNSDIENNNGNHEDEDDDFSDSVSSSDDSELGKINKKK
eukprot:gene7427-9129_t